MKGVIMKIEKNVKIPQRAAKGSVISSIKNMEVGDCLFFEGEVKQTDTKVDSIRKAMRRLGWSPKVRKAEDGLRIWRTK